jgi:hypothetical protein
MRFAAAGDGGKRGRRHVELGAGTGCRSRSIVRRASRLCSGHDNDPSEQPDRHDPPSGLHLRRASALLDVARSPLLDGGSSSQLERPAQWDQGNPHSPPRLLRLFVPLNCRRKAVQDASCRGFGGLFHPNPILFEGRGDCSVPQGCAEGRSPFAGALGVSPNSPNPPKSGGRGLKAILIQSLTCVALLLSPFRGTTLESDAG